MKKFILLFVGLVMALPLVILGTTGPASASISGNDIQGTWDKDTSVPSGTNSHVHVTWNSYNVAGTRYVKYDMSLWVGSLGSGDCAQVALDWDSDGRLIGWGDHEDVQIMRNCDSFTTRTMDAQTINIDKYCVSQGGNNCSKSLWPVHMLQWAMITPSTNLMWGFDCPDNTIFGTNTPTECSNWSPHADFGSPAAKIRLTRADGSESQSNPDWPGGYDIFSVKDPNN